MILAPPNRLNFAYEQFSPNAEIQIIIAGETDNTITNVTSVRIDESGFFWIPIYAPPPRILVVIAYFEGNENIFPPMTRTFFARLVDYTDVYHELGSRIKSSKISKVIFFLYQRTDFAFDFTCTIFFLSALTFF